MSLDFKKIIHYIIPHLQLFTRYEHEDENFSKNYVMIFKQGVFVFHNVTEIEMDT